MLPGPVDSKYSDLDSSTSESISDVSGAYTEIDEEQTQRSNILSIRILYLTIFLSSVGFSISLPSIWPYLKLLNPDVTKENLGLVVAIFSVGQLLGGLIFGAIINQFDSFKKPLLFSIGIMTIGNCIYANLFILPNKKWSYNAMIVSRVIIGFGSGNVAIVRAYITTFAKSDKRTAEIALMSAFQGLGFIFGPCIQTCFIPLKYPGYIHYRYFVLNVFNAAAFLGIFTCIINIVVIVIYFKDKSPSAIAPPMITVRQRTSKEIGGIFSTSYFRHHIKKQSEIIRKQSSILRSQIQKGCCWKFRHPTENNVDYLILILIMASFFSCMMLFSSIETILTPLLMDNFAWSFSTASMYGSVCLASSGMFAVLVFLSIGYSTKIFSERVHLLGGQLFCILACVALIPVFGPIPDLKYDYEKQGTTGCPVDEQPWCQSTPALTISALVVSIILFTMGYAISNVITTVLFAVTLGSGPQGLWMGLFTAVGSSSRIIGPFYVTYLYTIGGLVVVFGLMAGFQIFILVFFLILYKRLVPIGYSN